MSPFDAPGAWLRCALHAHTTNSDGELGPDMLVRHYDWAGYDVLAITDHWVRTEAASTPGLLVIPSTELNAVAGEEDDVHVLALGLDAEPIAPLAFEPIADVGAWIAATDDSHHPGYDSGFAWTWVRAEEKTQAAVLGALRAGAFYGSTGPEIRGVEPGDDEVVVHCSPAAAVTLYCGRWRGARANAGRLGYPNHARVLGRDDDGLLTSVALQRPWDGGAYGRVEVKAKDGTKAWTNPLWIA